MQKGKYLWYFEMLTHFKYSEFCFSKKFNFILSNLKVYRMVYYKNKDREMQVLKIYQMVSKLLV